MPPNIHPGAMIEKAIELGDAIVRSLNLTTPMPEHPAHRIHFDFLETEHTLALSGTADANESMANTPWQPSTRARTGRMMVRR